MYMPFYQSPPYLNYTVAGVVEGSTNVTNQTQVYTTPTTSYYYAVILTGNGLPSAVSSSTLYFYSPFQGPQGVQGSQGIVGIQGPTGITGPQGHRGLQGLMEIVDFAGQNQVLTSYTDTTHVKPNPTFTFDGTVLALTGNMNVSGAIATSAGFTGSTVSTSGLIYSGGFTGPLTNTINNLSIGANGSINTSGTIATSAGFTGPSVSAEQFITAAGGFTGPSVRTINGINIGLTNQNMSGIGTISAASGSSSIGGVTLNSGAVSGVTNINASGYIATSGGFTGPTVSTSGLISSGGGLAAGGAITGVTTLNASGAIATSAGFTGPTVSTSGLISSGGGLAAGGAITGVTTLNASGTIATSAGFTGPTVSTSGLIYSGGFTGPSVNTINGISIGATNQGMTGVASINGVAFGVGTTSATQTITAGSGSSSIGGVTLNNGSIQWGQYSNLFTGNGSTTTRLFGSYMNFGPLYNSDFFITNNMPAITLPTSIATPEYHNAIISATKDNASYGQSAIRLQSWASGKSAISFYIGETSRVFINGDGRLGVNCNAPQYPLDVNGTINGTSIRSTGGIAAGGAITGVTTLDTSGLITSGGGLAAGGAITGVTSITNNGNTTAIASIGTSAMPVTNIYGTLNGNATTSSSCSGNAATATTSSSCSGNAATATNFSGTPNISVGTIGASGAITAPTTVNTINSLIINSGTCTGVDFIATSDRRLKSDITTISNAMDIVKGMRGVYFTRIGQSNRSTGVIAQEVEEVLPEVVHTSDDGMKSVSYGNVVGVLIEAVKLLSDRLEKLER